MLIQGLFQKISENPALSDLVYLAGLQEHFQKNLTVLPSEGITDVQAEALIKALKGEIENDRSALDAWITRYFADGSKARLLHGKEKSLAELIRDHDPAWSEAKGTASDFKYIVPSAKKTHDKIVYFIGSPQIIDNSDDESFFHYLQSLQEQFPLERIRLLIPLSVNNIHWVLGEIVLNGGNFTHSVLRDSLDGMHSGKEKFLKVVTTLGVPEARQKHVNTGEQKDDFRCFDHVCREILRITGELEHLVVKEKSGASLRLAVTEIIAKNFPDNQLFSSPKKSMIFAGVTIEDPEILLKAQELMALLAAKNPGLSQDAGLTLQLAESVLQVSVPVPPERTPSSSSSFSDFGHTKKELFPDDDLSGGQKSAGLTHYELMEQRFMTHYADSSDEEDEGYSLDAETLKSNAGQLTKKFRKHRKDTSSTQEEPSHNDPKAISFILYVLGLMLLRAQYVKPYYQHLKAKKLALTSAEFDQFKRSFLGAFQAQFAYDVHAMHDFEGVLWPLFLEKFRLHAVAKSEAKKEILKAALLDVLSTTSPSATRSDLEIVATGLCEKITLPTWTLGGSIDISFNANFPDVNCQRVAMILFQYRIVRRLHKEKLPGKFVVKSACHDTPIEVEMGVKGVNRTDFLKGNIGAYPNLLDPAVAKKAEGKKHKGDQSSIKKFVDAGIKDPQIAVEMTGGVKDQRVKSKSYRNFSRKLCYLLLQVEVARNPGSYFMSMMMLQLIQEGHYTFKHCFPRDINQRKLSAPSHPECFHPMTLAGAPDLAVALNASFFACLPAKMIYRYDGRTADVADIEKFAKLQQGLVASWFSKRHKLKLADLPEDRILDTLCQAIAPKKK